MSAAEAEQAEQQRVEGNRDPADGPPAAQLRGDEPPKRKGPGGKRAGAGRPKGAGNKKPAASKPATKVAVSDAALQQALGELLTLPAVPAVMLTPSPEGKQFLGAHFTNQGPVAAAQLVLLSKQSPELRAALEKITTASVTMGLVMLAVGYAVPPVLWAVGQRGMAQGISMFATLSPDELAAVALAASDAQAAAAGAPMMGADGAQAQADYPEGSDAAAAAAGLAAARQAQAQHPPQ